MFLEYLLFSVHNVLVCSGKHVNLWIKIFKICSCCDLIHFWAVCVWRRTEECIPYVGFKNFTVFTYWWCIVFVFISQQMNNLSLRNIRKLQREKTLTQKQMLTSSKQPNCQCMFYSLFMVEMKLSLRIHFMFSKENMSWVCPLKRQGEGRERDWYSCHCLLWSDSDEIQFWHWLLRSLTLWPVICTDQPFVWQNPAITRSN